MWGMLSVGDVVEFIVVVTLVVLIASLASIIFMEAGVLLIVMKGTITPIVDIIVES